MDPQDRVRVIEQWTTRVTQDGGIDRYDDLHLDAIDPEWRQREHWGSAGSSAFQSAVAIRNNLRLPLIVGLGMSLRDDVLGLLHEVKLADLMADVGSSPPSLYLFRRGKEPGNDLIAAIHDGRVGADCASSEFVAIDVPDAKSGVFLRFKQSGCDEHATSVFILG